MVQMAWRQPPLTREEEDDLFMLLLEDDSEDAPWMVMGDLRFWSATGFAHSLRSYAHQQGLPWYVASMLPIEYEWPHAAHKKKLAPDTFVAFVPERTRTSYDLAAERQFPPFVLEVVSPSSGRRDQQEKRRAYELLGAQEYALFTPREGRASVLTGYRRTAQGRFEVWHPDAERRLWSDVLRLYLVVHGPLLQAQTPEGRLLRTPEQAEAALLTEEAARRHAEAALLTEEAARQHAEDENDRLRRELAHYREQEDTGAP